MSKKIIKTAFYGMVLSFLVLPLTVAAQYIPTGPGQRQVPEKPFTVEGLYGIFKNLANWIFAFALLLAVIMIIWGGVSYMTAGGDEEKIGTAKKRVIWGLVGVAIILAAWGLIYLVGNILGITVPGL